MYILSLYNRLKVDKKSLNFKFIALFLANSSFSYLLVQNVAIRLGGAKRTFLSLNKMLVVSFCFRIA